MTEPLTPVRIKVYGGSLPLLPPGSTWRIERITAHLAPRVLIGEVMPEWTLIDLAPIEVDIERLAAALDALSEDGLEYDLMAPEEREERREVAERLAAEYERLSPGSGVGNHDG